MAFWPYIIGAIQGVYGRACPFSAIRNNRKARRNSWQARRNTIARRNNYKCKRNIIAPGRAFVALTLECCVYPYGRDILLRDCADDVTLLRESNFRPVPRNIIA